MARMTDNHGRLVGGFAAQTTAISAPMPEVKVAPIQTPTFAPIPPRYGSNEDVRWLECNYGSMSYVTYSPNDAVDDCPDAREIGCHNHIDKPRMRHHCPSCGGDYCAAHADLETHDCNSVMRIHPQDAPG